MLGSIREEAQKMVIMNHFHSYVIRGIARRVIVSMKEREDYTMTGVEKAVAVAVVLINLTSATEPA